MKTALIRLPFALMGLFGLVLFAFSVRRFFLNAGEFKLFLSLFVFIELFSISLVLHLTSSRQGSRRVSWKQLNFI